MPLSIVILYKSDCAARHLVSSIQYQAMLIVNCLIGRVLDSLIGTDEIKQFAVLSKKFTES